MSEMVERGAKAMFDHLVKDDGPYSFCGGKNEKPDGVTLDGNFDLVELFRIGFAATREPTKDMIEVGLTTANNETPGESSPYSGIGIKVWQAMIDEALK